MSDPATIHEVAEDFEELTNLLQWILRRGGAVFMYRYEKTKDRHAENRRRTSLASPDW